MGSWPLRFSMRFILMGSWPLRCPMKKIREVEKKVDKKDQIVRDYYICLQGNAFKRIVYSRNEKIIVHYVGNESSAIRLPHGNIKQKKPALCQTICQDLKNREGQEILPRSKKALIQRNCLNVFFC